MTTLYDHVHAEFAGKGYSPVKVLYDAMIAMLAEAEQYEAQAALADVDALRGTWIAKASASRLKAAQLAEKLLPYVHPRPGPIAAPAASNGVSINIVSPFAHRE